MPNRPKSSKLSRWIGISLFAHACVVALFLFLGLSGNRFFSEPPAIRVHIVQKGKKRDEKLLPRIVEQAPNIQEEVKHEEPAPPEPEAPKPEVTLKPQKHQIAPPPKVAKKKPASGRKSLHDVLNKRVKQIEREGDPEGAEYGNSVIGELSDAYHLVVLARLKENFIIPESISARERVRLDAEINVRISEDGALITANLVSSSGNTYYDDIVIARTKEITSFGAPPLMLRKSLKRGGLNIHMCPGICPN